jgi:polar amino acid transport system permease protein
MTAMTAAILAMTINLTAYAIEIVRAGIEAVPPGQREASLALGLKPVRVFIYVILPQALANVYPALVSQVIIIMLESAVVSQIAVMDLTHVADYIQSRPIALSRPTSSSPWSIWGWRLDCAGRWRAGSRLFAAITMSISVIDILWFLLAAALTLLRSAIAFVGGGTPSAAVLLRYARPNFGARFMDLYVEVLQGTPLLLQLFLVFFGLPLLGIDVSPILAAGVALTLYASAFLGEIWRGCVDAIGRGQWEASASLGMKFVAQMRYVILPQALKIAIPPTVGFLVQLVKSTALASIVGFSELIKAGQIVTNATFQPVVVYGLVALIYFCMCFPLTYCARLLERKLSEPVDRGKPDDCPNEPAPLDANAPMVEMRNVNSGRVPGVEECVAVGPQGRGVVIAALPAPASRRRSVASTGWSITRKAIS